MQPHSTKPQSFQSKAETKADSVGQFSTTSPNLVNKRKRRNNKKQKQQHPVDEKDEVLDTKLIDNASMSTQQPRLYSTANMPKQGQPGNSYNVNAKQSKNVKANIKNVQRSKPTTEPLPSSGIDVLDQRAKKKVPYMVYRDQGGFEIQDSITKIGDSVLIRSVTSKDNRPLIQQALLAQLYTTVAAQLLHSCKDNTQLRTVLYPQLSRLENTTTMFTAMSDIAYNYGDIVTPDGRISVDNPSSTVFVFLIRAFLCFKGLDLSQFEHARKPTLSQLIALIEEDLCLTPKVVTTTERDTDEEEEALKRYKRAYVEILTKFENHKKIHAKINCEKDSDPVQVEVVQMVYDELIGQKKEANDLIDSPPPIYKKVVQHKPFPTYFYGKGYMLLPESKHIGERLYEHCRKFMLQPSLGDYHDQDEKPFLYPEQKEAAECNGNSKVLKIDDHMRRVIKSFDQVSEIPSFMQSPSDLVSSVNILVDTIFDVLASFSKKIDLQVGTFKPRETGSTAQLFTADEGKIYFPVPLSKMAMLTGLGLQIATPGSVYYQAPVKCFRDDAEEFIDTVLTKDLRL